MSEVPLYMYSPLLAHRVCIYFLGAPGTECLYVDSSKEVTHATTMHPWSADLANT